VSHVQLFAIYYIPYLAIGIYLFLRDFPKATSVGRFGGILAAAILPAIFYTSYYVGWFSLFFLLLFSGVSYVWAVLHSDGPAFGRHTIWNRGNWKRLLPYFAFSAVCFVPFVITYLPALRQFGGRRYPEIASMLPSLVDYVNVGPTNWLWGRLLYATFPGLGARPMAHELIKGLPICLLLVFLASLVYFIDRIRRHRVSASQADSPGALEDGNASNDHLKLATLAAGLSAAILLAWLLMLKIQDLSLWWLVSKVIPGASAIRAVYRFQHVLAFPLAVVVAIALQQFAGDVARGVHSRRARHGRLVALAVCCLLLVAEQFNTGSVSGYGKQQQRNMLSRIEPPPRPARVFALLPAAGFWQGPYEAAIDSMIIAQQYGLYTVNGYSGQLPRGGEDIDKPAYLPNLVRWIRHYNLENEHLYFLDERTGVWSSAMGSHSPMNQRQDLMGAPLGDADFALSLSAEEVPARWQKNEVRRCAVRVKNNSGTTLSGVGSDFDEPGKYAIRLSYRWVEAGSLAQPLSGFDNRTGLPEAVKPKAEITVEMEAAAPSRPGKYWLEIEAVQELVAWFKDKGSAGVRIEVEVQ
jgi:hypothetical protein